MLLDKATKGSTSSARPSGVKMLQVCIFTSGFRRESTAQRCSQAFWSRLSVVIILSLAIFPGVKFSNGSTSYDLTMRLPPGVCNGALVACGSARLTFLLFFGVAFGPSDTTLAVEEVGVKMGGIATSEALLRLLGVDGLESCDTFRFADPFLFGGSIALSEPASENFSASLVWIGFAEPMTRDCPESLEERRPPIFENKRVYSGLLSSRTCVCNGE